MRKYKYIVIVAVAALLVGGCSHTRPGADLKSSDMWTSAEAQADPQGYQKAYADYSACTQANRSKLQEDVTEGQGVMAALSAIPGVGAIARAASLNKTHNATESAAKEANRCIDYLKHPSRR